MQTYPTYGPIGAPIQREPYTPKGVRWCLIAFVIYLAALSVQIAQGCWISLSLDSVTSGAQSVFYSAMMVAYIGISAILNLLAVVFFLVGFGHFYSGKVELGAQRAKRLDMALYLMIAAIVAAVIGNVISFSLELSNYALFEPTRQPDPGVYYAIVAVNAITGTLVAAFSAAAIALPILGLIDQNRDKQLYLAVALGTATPGVVAAVAFLQMPSIINALVDRFGNLNWSSGLPSVVSGFLGLVTFLLFLILYRNVLQRIHSGILRPIRPPPAPQIWVPVQMYPVVPIYPVYPPIPPQPVTPPQTPPQEPAK